MNLLPEFCPCGKFFQCLRNAGGKCDHEGPMNDNPLPCPFCGSAAIVVEVQPDIGGPGSFFVRCVVCFGQGPDRSEWPPENDYAVFRERNRAAAIAAWNMRP
jgi:Lar family restriction alleviation protein